MFTKLFRKKIETATSELIDAANTHLFGLTPGTAEYDDTLEAIERLHKLENRESEGRRVSPDTLLIVLANLAGIVLILNYEKLDIVTSKAFGLIMKTKV